MTSSQVQVSETPPMSQQDLEGLKDENGLYAGKFKTVEDLANSYKELEGKLGSVTEEDQVSESTEETTGVPEGYEDYYQEDGTVDYNSVNENYGEPLSEGTYKVKHDIHDLDGEVIINKDEDIEYEGITETIMGYDVFKYKNTYLTTEDLHANT